MVSVYTFRFFSPVWVYNFTVLFYTPYLGVFENDLHDGGITIKIAKWFVGVLFLPRAKD